MSRDSVAHSARHHTAEREGFEPSDPVTQVNSLAVSPIRPLSHLSVPGQWHLGTDCHRPGPCHLPILSHRRPWERRKSREGMARQAYGSGSTSERAPATACAIAHHRRWQPTARGAGRERPCIAESTARPSPSALRLGHGPPEHPRDHDRRRALPAPLRVGIRAVIPPTPSCPPGSRSAPGGSSSTATTRVPPPARPVGRPCSPVSTRHSTG